MDHYQAMEARRKLLDSYVHIDWDYLRDKTVLDIGPAYGIWSMRAATAGAQVEAVEIGPQWCQIFKEITTNRGFNLQITQSDILTFTPNKKYQIVFFLAVWHHVPRYSEAWDKIFELCSDRLYLEGPINSQTITHKHKVWGERPEQAFYYEPSEKDLLESIENHGGKVLFTNYNQSRSRIFLIVSK